ncbi:MAG: hypothetical protein PHI34_13530, partial [Acidobacteriota bacterium]|nr:hypothetical protein [Acidobacteriota bacterium]
MPSAAKLRFAITFILASILMAGCRGERPRSASGQGAAIEAVASVRRAAPGDKVVVRIKAPALRKAADLRADLLVPGRGVRSLAVRPDPAGTGEWTADIDIPGQAPEGFYAVTVSGPAGKGRAAAKASWLVGRAIGDFFITSGVDASDPAGDIERCLRGFMNIGGNLVVVHDNINGRAWYP